MFSVENINKARKANYSDDDILDAFSMKDPEMADRISKARDAKYDSKSILEALEMRLNQVNQQENASQNQPKLAPKQDLTNDGVKQLDNPDVKQLYSDQVNPEQESIQQPEQPPEVKPESPIEEPKKNEDVKQTKASWWDHFNEGLQRSVSGGAVDSELSQDPGFWNGLVQFGGEFVGDSPYIAAGASLGAALGAQATAAGGPWGATAGGIVGGGFGSLALPSFLKQAMKEYRDYAEKGNDLTFGEFLERADRIGSETLKSGLMGVILGQVNKAAPMLKEIPGLGKLFTTKIGAKAGEVALETAALGTIPKVSAGEIPTKQDYAEALMMVLGMQVTKIPTKIREGIQKQGEATGFYEKEWIKSIPREEITEIGKIIGADPEVVTKNLDDIHATIIKSSETAKTRNLKDRITSEAEKTKATQENTNKLVEDLPKGNKKNLAKEAVKRGYIRTPEHLDLFLDEYEAVYDSLPGKTGKDKNRKFMNRFASENNPLENVKQESGKPVVDIKPSGQRRVEMGVTQKREGQYEGDKAKVKAAKKAIDLGKRKAIREADQKAKESKESEPDVKQLDIEEKVNEVGTENLKRDHGLGEFKPEDMRKINPEKVKVNVSSHLNKPTASILVGDKFVGIELTAKEKALLKEAAKEEFQDNSDRARELIKETESNISERVRDQIERMRSEAVKQEDTKTTSKKLVVKPARLSIEKPKEKPKPKEPKPIIETTGEGAEQRLEEPLSKTEKVTKKATEIVEAVKTPSIAWERFNTRMFDALEPLNRLEKDIPVEERVTTKIKEYQNAASTINSIMAEGVFDNVTNRFTSDSLEQVYKGNGEIWKKFTKGLKPGEYSIREFDEYRQSKEALKRQKRGLVSGIDTAIAEKDVARLKQKYGPIEQRIHQFQKDILGHYGKDLFTPEIRDQWTKEAHASLHRVMDYGDDAMLPKGSLEPKQPFHKAKGSKRKIIPASESDVKNLSMLVMNAKKNESILQYKKGVEKGELPGKIKESKNKAIPEEMIEDLGLDPDNLALAETLYNQSRKDAFTPKDGRIKGWENGVPFEIEVPGDVYETFTSLSPADTGTITNILKSASRIMSKGITLEPIKHLSIFGRDAWSSLIYSKTGSNPLSIVRALTDIYKDTESWKKFKAMGGEQYASRMLSRADRVESVEKLLKVESPNVTIVPFKKFGDFLSKHSSNLVASVPFAEYQRALKKFGDTPEGRTKALIESKSVSYDPNKKGSSKLVKAMANVQPFFNVMLQEPYMIAKNMKRPLFWAKGAVGITIPSLIMKIINDGNPDYDDLSPISKTMFMHFYTPAGHFAVPAPWLLGALFKGVPEAFYDTVKNEGGEAWHGLYSYVASQMAGTWNPIITGVYEQTSNKTLPSPGAIAFSPFIEQERRAPPVVPRKLENLPPEQQYTSKTSQLARWWGALWKASPVKVERLIKTFGGGVAGDTLALIDEIAYASGLADDLRPEQSMQNNFIISKILSDNTPTHTKYTEQFYSELEKSRIAKQRDQPNDNKRLNDYNTKISALLKKYVQIEKQDIDRSKKKQQLQDYQKKINALYKEAVTQSR